MGWEAGAALLFADEDSLLFAGVEGFWRWCCETLDGQEEREQEDGYSLHI